MGIAKPGLPTTRRSQVGDLLANGGQVGIIVIAVILIFREVEKAKAMKNGGTRYSPSDLAALLLDISAALVRVEGNQDKWLQGIHDRGLVDDPRTGARVSYQQRSLGLLTQLLAVEDEKKGLLAESLAHQKSAALDELEWRKTVQTLYGIPLDEIHKKVHE
jgi:hypothetical protein